jgi:hypothetical protein
MWTWLRDLVIGLEPMKGGFEALQAAATAGALLAAGIWTYLLFVRQRQRFPRAEMTHRVVSIELSSYQVLVHAVVLVKNIGSVLIRLREGFARIDRLRPVPSRIAGMLAAGEDPVPVDCSEARWETLKRRDCVWAGDPREIEPGEADEFHFDFFVAADVRTVELYSYFENIRKRRFSNWFRRERRSIGWNHTSIVELDQCRIERPTDTKGRQDGESEARGERRRQAAAEQRPAHDSSGPTEAAD